MVKNEKRQKYIQIILFAFLFLLLCFPQKIAAAEAQVIDNADLLTEQEEAEIFEQAKAVSDQTGWSVFLVTTEDTQGKSTSAYADDFYDEMASEEDGFLLLIDMDNREIYMSTSGEAIRYYTDSRIDTIVTKGAEDAGNLEYASCFSTMLEEALKQYESGIPSNQYEYDTETGKVSRYRSITKVDVILALIAGVAAGLGVFFYIKSSYGFQTSTSHYVPAQNGNIEYEVERDHLVNSFVHHHHIERNTNDSSGGNRSSVHTSSSGKSHGGGGHGF